MNLRGKGVSTLGEFVIIIGVILISVLFLLSFQKTITQETEVAKEMSVKEIGERIAGLMRRIDSEPSYAVQTIKIPKTSVEVKDGILTVERNENVFSESVPSNSRNTFLEDSLKITIIKQNDQITLSNNPPICNLNFLCEPMECFSDCRDCYGPSPICIGDGNCTKAIGETCENSPQDCACANGKECCPTHPNADNHSCLNITERKDEGGQCYCDNQCSNNLNCNPTHQDFNGYEKACCPKGKAWDGNKCVFSVCPSTISICFNNWHWKNQGEAFVMNKQGKTCDYFETCYTPIVKDIAEEIKRCCDNKCSGNCHSMCNKAVSESGLASTENQQTRKKCYGLYTIYGLGPAAKWTQGYLVTSIEKPASIMLSHGTWMCTGYSIMLTTLLRSVGYSKNDVYSACGPQHAYNLVKLPGESKYRFVDTTGNHLYISGISGTDPYRVKHGYCRSNFNRPCQNDEISSYSAYPSKSQIIMGASC